MTLTSDDLETTTKQLAGHVLVINDTLYLIIHHLVRMLCTNLDCLCWLAAILDFRENRAFSMEGFMGIFNCGQEGYKRTDFRCETLYCNFVQPQMFIYPTTIRQCVYVTFSIKHHVTLPLIITDPRMQHLNYCKCVWAPASWQHNDATYIQNVVVASPK